LFFWNGSRGTNKKALQLRDLSSFLVPWEMTGPHLEVFRRLGFIDAPHHEELNPKGHPSLEAVLFPTLTRTQVTLAPS
jgi:hypothetical protein